MTNLHEENALLKKKVEYFEMKWSQAEMALIKEQAEKLEEIAKIIKLNDDIHTMALAIVIGTNNKGETEY
ncbi:hypothetical protein ACFLTV_00210 [Chloroflexota bacterium]